jgi:hypothetical protein
LDDVRTDLRRGTWRRPELGRQRLDEYAVWSTSRELKPRTRELYAGLLDLRILPALGASRLDQLTPQSVRDWHNALADTGAVRRLPTGQYQASCTDRYGQRHTSAHYESERAARQWLAQTRRRLRLGGPTARAQSYRLLRTIMNEAVRDSAIVANPCVIRGT